jgi:hypothetical protein
LPIESGIDPASWLLFKYLCRYVASQSSACMQM